MTETSHMAHPECLTCMLRNCGNCYLEKTNIVSVYDQERIASNKVILDKLDLIEENVIVLVDRLAKHREFVAACKDIAQYSEEEDVLGHLEDLINDFEENICPK